jgi:hypothetical protein
MAAYSAIMTSALVRLSSALFAPRTSAVVHKTRVGEPDSPAPSGAGTRVALGHLRESCVDATEPAPPKSDAQEEHKVDRHCAQLKERGHLPRHTMENYGLLRRYCGGV